MKLQSKNLKFLILVVPLFALPHLSSLASGLNISRPLLYIEGEESYAVFNVEWDNAWNNNRNHDAIWIFFKSVAAQEGCLHIRVGANGHTVVAQFTSPSAPLDFGVPEDRTGLFLYPAGPYRGTIRATVKIVLDHSDFERVDPFNSTLDAFGVEMVYIPEGRYRLGDRSLEARESGGFFDPNDVDNTDPLVRVVSEIQELEIGPDGDIYYQAGEGYEGDQEGLVLSTFPKGVTPFYIMKYEPTESEYVRFLNSLSPGQASGHLVFTEEAYYDLGGTIRSDHGQYVAGVPRKPAFFIGWDDAMAFADWAGLRPMTEFEFTKAARGTGDPVPGEFPWGTASKDQVQRLPGDSGILEMRNGWPESYLSDSTKPFFGASYYWVLDLAGSLWERVVSVGHSLGREFTGVEGDGTLTPEGMADVENWPTGEEGSGGIGFRGGGFYGYNRQYHEFNPFSPVGYRPYGAWQGGVRSHAYGTRFVRSVR